MSLVLLPPSSEKELWSTTAPATEPSGPHARLKHDKRADIAAKARQAVDGEVRDGVADRRIHGLQLVASSGYLTTTFAPPTCRDKLIVRLAPTFTSWLSVLVVSKPAFITAMLYVPGLTST